MAEIDNPFARCEYHYVEKAKVNFILKEGLRPSKSEKRRVFLWDSLNLAMNSSFILARWSELRVAILEVEIPRSWTELDDNYLASEREYGHSFKVRRFIPPERIRLRKTLTLNPSQ
jgi:hypothetical protein